ncbi:Oligoribonuclease [Buchnera aphidicola (Anoecia corni)]|uniref:Oligoribonuclease n=1 Tax=Buchnera aphidicola (Anoecia corni) TaxID=2994477 RepID=A0AAT9IIS5_9GAMM
MKSNNLVWIDLEMTGLNPNFHKIIEIAIIITDIHLNILSIGPCIAINQSKKNINLMNSWNRITHKKTGLLTRVQTSSYNEKKAEKEIILFLKKWIPRNSSPLCGNSINKDRQFLLKYMKRLELYFHYRSIDVSTIKELIKRWNPYLKLFKKKSIHNAKNDLLESIKELKFYKKNFFINFC